MEKTNLKINRARLILLALLLSSSFVCQSQENEKRALFLSAKSGYLSIKDFGPRYYGGIELDAMVGDRLGIHYSLLLGEKYFHMPLAPIGGVFAGLAVGKAAADSTKTFGGLGAGLLIGLITSIIPEGVSYNIPVNNTLTLAPYISPLQFEYLKTTEGQDSFAGGGVGFRLHKNLKENLFRISPYFEYKMHYHRDFHNGFSTGLNFSVNLKKGA
jgi:hypothetical protein